MIGEIFALILSSESIMKTVLSGHVQKAFGSAITYFAFWREMYVMVKKNVTMLQMKKVSKSLGNFVEKLFEGYESFC